MSEKQAPKKEVTTEEARKRSLPEVPPKAMKKSNKLYGNLKNVKYKILKNVKNKEVGKTYIMLEDKALWVEPLQFFRKRATKLKVGDFILAPSENEYIDDNATLGEAIQQLVIYPYHSLLVTRGDEVVGILRLSDVFTKICDIIKGD